jgi:hypothetical protein
MRISEKIDNPVKYTDPDGRISEKDLEAFLKSTNNDYGIDYFAEAYNNILNGHGGDATISILTGLTEVATDILNGIIAETTGLDPLRAMDNVGHAAQTLVKASKDNGLRAVDKITIALHALKTNHNHTFELDAYNVDDMLDVINSVLDAPWLESKSGNNGRIGFYDPQLGTVVIYDPYHEGTVMKYSIEQWEDWE